MRRYHKAIAYFAMAGLLGIGLTSYCEIAKAATDNKQLIEEQELESKKTSKYDSYADTTPVKNIIKDSVLFDIVLQEYQKYDSSKDETNFTKQDLASFEGTINISSYTTNRSNVKSVEGLGCAKKAEIINLSGTNITAIPVEEFKECGFKSITLPDSVTSIGKSAFEGCINLTSFAFPSGITSLGESAFYGCKALVSINSDSGNNTLPLSLTYIGQKAFMGDKSLTNIIIPAYTTGNTLENSPSLFSGCSGLKTIVISDSITVIPDSAFLDAGKSVDTGVSVTFGNGVTQILPSAFENVKFSSTKLNLYNTHVNSISSDAFKGTNLEKVILTNKANIPEDKNKNGKKHLVIGARAFANTPITVLNEKEIKDEENEDEKIYIPDYVDKIGEGCFYGNTAMTEVSLSPFIDEIPDYTFDGCTKLEKVHQRVFNGQCEVTLIGDAAFRNTAITDTLFLKSMNKLVQIGRQFVDDSSKYKAGYGISYPKDDNADGKIKTINLGGVGMPDGFTISSDGQKTNKSNDRFGSEVFTGCDKLKYVIIPAAVENVATRAFYKATAVEEITWDEGNTDRKVHSGAFQGCSSLEKIIFPLGGSLDIERYAFANDISLKSIRKDTKVDGFPNSLKRIGTGAFFNCSSLPKIIINDYSLGGAPTIEDMAFEQCNKLSTAILPKSMTAIPRHMFYNASITSFAFESPSNGSQVTKIGTLAFCGHQMTDINLNDYASLDEIGAGAFAATNFVKENNVEIFDKSSVTNAPKLVSVTMPAKGDAGHPNLFINTAAFYAQSGFTTMKFLGGTDEIGKTNGVVAIPDYAYANQSRAIFGATAVSKVVWEADKTGVNKWEIIPPLMYKSCPKIIDAMDVLPQGNYVKEIYAGAFLGSSVQTVDLSRYTSLVHLSTGTISELSGETQPGAFESCKKLTTVTLPNCNFDIGKRAFGYDDMLSNVALGGVTSIGEKAFLKDSSITEIEFPATLDSIGQDSFFSCVGMQKVSGWNNLSLIGMNAFKECTSLSDVELPDTLTEIGNSAFEGDISLENIVFRGQLKKIGTSAFASTGLVKPDFSAATNLTTIGSKAFYDAKKLEEFNITNTSVTKIEGNTLQNCLALESALFGEKTQYIAEDALAGCPKLNLFAFYSETLVDRKVFNSPVDLGGGVKKYSTKDAESKLNIEIKVPEGRTIVPLGQDYDLPYYVNSVRRSEISTIVIGPGQTDSSVKEMMRISAQRNIGYYWNTTELETNRITDPAFFEPLEVSKSKKHNGYDVDYIAIKPLKTGDVDVQLTAKMTFDCKDSNPIESGSSTVTFKLSVEEINFRAKVYSDSTRKTEVPATVDYQVTASDTSRQCYYSMICDRDDVAFTIPCYDIVAISDNPDVVAIAATKTGTYPEGGYQTSKATNVNASTGAITANTTAMGFVVLPKKVGTATISIYPKDFVGDNRYVTTIKYNVNSDISEIKLAIPEAYKKGVPNGSTFNVFSSMKTALGDSCDATNVANMASITNQTITYESSAPEYATVDAAGNVTIINADAKANKSVKITAKAANSEKGRPVSNQVSFNILKDESLQYKVESNAVNAESTDKNSKTIVVVTTPADSVTKQGEVAIKKSTADSKATSIAVPDAVTINGIKYAVTAIKPNAYANLKNLTSVSIGSNVKTIDSKAFSGCKKLTTVNITDKSVLENIGSNAFANCKALTTVTIPKGTKTIGTKAFYNCKKLVTINVKSKVLKKVGKNALKGINKKCVINVPKKQFKKYKKLFKGKGQKKSVKVKKAF